MLTFGIGVDLDLKDARLEAMDSLKAIVREWSGQKMRGRHARRRQFRHDERLFQDEDRSVWQFEFMQAADDNGTWTTEVRALTPALPDRSVATTVSMRIEFEDVTLAPVRYFVEPPAFLRQIGEHFSVRIGQSSTSLVPRNVRSEDDASALLGELEHPGRTLPIVFVSPPGDSGTAIPGLADMLAKHLFGLAIVVDASTQGANALKRHLGRFACYGGAIRIYWPGWKPSDSLHQHPIYLGSRVAASAIGDPDHPDQQIRTALLAPLVRAASARFSYPKAMQRVIRAHQRRQLERELGERPPAELLRQVADLRAELADKEEIHALALSENESLSETVRAFRAENEILRNEKETLSLKNQALRGQLDDKNAVPRDEAPDDDDRWNVETAEEAIALAREDFKDTLVIPENAHVQTTMPGGHLYGVLRSLHELCEIERQGKASNKREQLRDRLVDNVGLSRDTYKKGDTDVHCVDPETGKREHLRERVHIKEGKPADTESVYWKTLGAKQSDYRYLIGRIGRHA